MEKTHYVFGPVASRRLGISLGIDLLPPKTCSLDCVYCEAGATTERTLERREYVPTEAVIAELDRVLSLHPKLDFITFSGSGEPTLHVGIGKVIAFLKARYPEYRICLLTNALGFGDVALQKEIDGVDLCVPSLDASNEEEFQKINRPVPGIHFDSFKQALIDYTRQASHEVVLELFIVPGVNDSDASIARFAAMIGEMKLKKVQLNTLDRPGVVDWILPSDRANTERFIRALEPIVPVEAVGVFQYKSVALCSDMEMTQLDQTVLNLIRRRPATLDDLVVACRSEAKTVKERLDAMLHAGLITAERRERGTFFAANTYRKQS